MDIHVGGKIPDAQIAPMATQCTASPGWYCLPLDGSVTICQESWYCPGGNLPPKSCQDGIWSAMQSSQLSDCQDHMNVSLAIAITVLLVSLAIVLCCWFSYLLEPSSKPAVCYPSHRCAYAPLNPCTPLNPYTPLNPRHVLDPTDCGVYGEPAGEGGAQYSTWNHPVYTRTYNGV